MLSGSLDAAFKPLASGKVAGRGGVHWLKIRLATGDRPSGIPVLVVHAARQTQSQLFTRARSTADPGRTLARAAALPSFRGTQDTIFQLPGDWSAGSSPIRLELEPTWTGWLMLPTGNNDYCGGRTRHSLRLAKLETAQLLTPPQVSGFKLERVNQAMAEVREHQQ